MLLAVVVTLGPFLELASFVLLLAFLPEHRARRLTFQLHCGALTTVLSAQMLSLCTDALCTDVLSAQMLSAQMLSAQMLSAQMLR